MKKTSNYISHLLGFEKLSGYERSYLHDKNMQGGIYLGFITVILEIWMLVRQTVTRIVPKYQDGADVISLLVKYTTKYWLFLLVGLGFTLFCLFIRREKKLTKGKFVTLLAVGSVCMLYTPVLCLERFIEKSDAITPVMADTANILIVSLYLSLFVFGAVIVIYVLLRYLKNKNIVFPEHLTVGLFSLICIEFGLLVSYTDFWEEKQITCFLMVMIYVGFLMIYRPFITILILGTCFGAFYRILLTFQDGVSFKAKEVVISGTTYNVSSGDTVNYITFFISLTTVCIAIYHGRLKEARKAYDLTASTVALEKKNREMHEQFIQTSKALASAIDAKDPYTNGHSVRVAEYSRTIAENAGKPFEECENIYYAALLHDVGKIGVSKSILAKPGRLTDEEFEQIKKHTLVGSQILSNISLIPWLSIGAHYHHERYNGRGYPEGLKGEEIPEIARIIAVADAYDAMTSNRSYRNAIPQHIVREELVKGSGIQFDPEYARIMIHLIDLDIEYNMKERISGENIAKVDSLRCKSIYHDSSDGIVISKDIISFTFCCQPDDGVPASGSLPSLIVFDSLDGQVHHGEENNKDLLYYEYARIRLDGQVTASGARKSEVRMTDGGIDAGRSCIGESENGKRYRIDAIRNRDHALIRVSTETGAFDVILALPDPARYTYLSITGENCVIHNLRMDTGTREAGDTVIPRIAEEISYIKGCPVGDIPNIEVDGPRASSSVGIPISDGMTLSFHTMSYPTARLVWHCPYFCIFSSANGQIDGDDYHEYLLLKLNGENWESTENVINEVSIEQTSSFKSWDSWLDQNKQGLDCVVDIRKEGSRVVMRTEAAGIAIISSTSVHDGTEDLYLAITGDQCAVTDIRVKRV